MTDYAGLVKEFVKQGIDLIISGAGLPLNLPEFIEGSKTKIAPIVSSLRCCQLIVKTWRRKYNYVPDMIVIEGPKAGGHLGFKRDELFAQDDKKPSLETITSEIVSFVRDLEKETGKEIPVIAAGGVFDGRDIQKFLSLGADGVQMATRFVATDECDASDAFKNAYVNASEEDIQIIDSPVGMPGRAIRNEFIKSKEDHKLSITKCYQCIKTCNVKDAPYCITKALINAVKGNLDEGFIFCGSNVGRVKEIVPVHDLIQELMSQCEAASVRTA
jgi:NAD(P)H-dependent flavin oxidoreductase YrpB (nitropropane dioxygenase family)